MSEKLTPLSRADCDFCGRAAVVQCKTCRMLVCYPHSEDHVCSAPTWPTQSLTQAKATLAATDPQYRKLVAENDAIAGAAVIYDAKNRSAHEQVAFELWDAVTGNEDEDVPACAAELAAAEERGRRRGVELLRECDEALKTAIGTVECMSVFPPDHELAGRELLWHKLAVAARAKIAALAPRDSAPVRDPYVKAGVDDWSGAPRDRECDCDSPLFQGSHLASCPKMQPRDSGKEEG